MDQPASREARLRELIALAEETVQLVKELMEGLEEQITEWKRLADEESPQTRGKRK
jgi:hypothetical protein